MASGVSQTRSDSDLIRELASEMRDVKKLVLDLLLMQGNVPDNVKKQKRLNIQGLRDRYGAMAVDSNGAMDTMDAQLNKLVKEMETEYTAGVDYDPPKDEEGIPGDGVEPQFDSAAPEPEPEPEPEAEP